MQYADGRYSLVFNGEIYNYVELREELEQLGYRFRSTGDTEVLLAAYDRWGAAAFSRLVGMFAFALLDAAQRKVVLCRDYFGIKPMYYSIADGTVYFASELPALMEFVPSHRDVDAAQLYRYLRYGITDDGTCTLFSNIHQLPAAHYAEIDLDAAIEVRPQAYWNPVIRTRDDISFDEAVREVRRLFLQNVAMHLRSDVPVGSALSGGIDSSAVVAAMRHLDNNVEIHAFSYIASDSPLNEERWVDMLAAHARATVHKVYPQAGELVDELRTLSVAQGEPFRSTSIYAQYRVFQEARRAGIKVILDGQGADEMLAGYRSFLGVRLASLVRSGNLAKAGRFLRRCMAQPGVSVSYLVQKAAEYLLPQEVQGPLRKLVGKELMPPWLNEAWFRREGVNGAALQRVRGESLLKSELLRDVRTTSLPALLRYEDRNSMAFSIESRVPFLTPGLVEFVFSLPEQYIIGDDGTTKRVFREAMRGIVPDAILDRRDKIGFATPEQQWMRGLDAWIRKLLSSDAARSIPALDLARTKDLWDATVDGKMRCDFEIWRALNVIHWSQQFNVTYA
jgi:asparagine synthase (glutamine-hydrolysing)